jgi:phosphoribosylformimino-5-aminoimidazole carboxamide ribotide isomerase
MLIMPAIDLQRGVCVRLLRGDFDEATRYGAPAAQLKAFENAGASWVHIVDLDAARAGTPVQYELIASLAQRAKLKLQCGGGVRRRQHVKQLLESGVARVVVGSAAIKQPNEVHGWLAEFGAAQICLALDVRRIGPLWEVVLSGWSEASGVSLEGALELYASEQIRHVLVTDVSRDGALTGPNTNLIQRLSEQYPSISFQASGGVAKLADLKALKCAGAAVAIVGRALYEERFKLEDAIAL